MNTLPCRFLSWKNRKTPKLKKDPINKIKMTPVMNSSGDTSDTSTKSTAVAPLNPYRPLSFPVRCFL
jgi:hypothetical protein